MCRCSFAWWMLLSTLLLYSGGEVPAAGKSWMHSKRSIGGYSQLAA